MSLERKPLTTIWSTSLGSWSRMRSSFSRASTRSGPMSCPQSKSIWMVEPSVAECDVMRRTRLIVASASSAGRVISSSTCAGSELG